MHRDQHLSAIESFERETERVPSLLFGEKRSEVIRAFQYLLDVFNLEGVTKEDLEKVVKAAILSDMRVLPFLHKCSVEGIGQDNNLVSEYLSLYENCKFGVKSN